MITFTPFTVNSGLNQTSTTRRPQQWTHWGGQGLSLPNTLQSAQVKRGCMVPSIVRGSWGSPFTLSPSDYAIVNPSATDARNQRCVFEYRTSSDGGVTWTSWRTDVGWENLAVYETDTVNYQYRWRMPIPYTNYIRVEYDTVAYNRSVPGSGLSVDSYVIDECYKDLYVSSLMSHDYGYAQLAPYPSALASNRAFLYHKARSVSGERDVVPRGGFFDTQRVDVTATDVSLCGIALAAEGADEVPGIYSLTITPDFGASGRAVFKRLYQDSLPLSGGQTFPAGAILDSAGGTVSELQTIQGSLTGTYQFMPIYSGGRVTSVTPVSGLPGAVAQGYTLVPTGFFGSEVEEAGTIARIILAGTGGGVIVYTPQSEVLTDADKGAGYHPFDWTTWPATPTRDLISNGTDIQWLSCPRFFIQP